MPRDSEPKDACAWPVKYCTSSKAHRVRADGALLAAAVLVYLVIAGALIAAGPGPNYDEALFQVGAVQMLNSREAPAIIQPSRWLPFAGRSWPVMIMPYAGAASFYLLLPVFAVFGPGLVAARVAVAVLAAFGLWGLGRLVGVATGPKAAAAVVLALAVHPGFLSNTAFNDSGFAYWMAAIGAAGLALRKYLERRTATWAVVVGLACGLGVWTRLNFAWLIGGIVLGVLVAFGRRAIPPRSTSPPRLSARPSEARRSSSSRR